MKIIVCIKQVPARDSQLRVASSGAWIQDADLSYEINEPDAYRLCRDESYATCDRANEIYGQLGPRCQKLLGLNQNYALARSVSASGFGIPRH